MADFLNDSDWMVVEAHVERESSKAILLTFRKPNSDVSKWIPKSCYREFDTEAFHYQQIKKWWIAKERLWEIIKN